MGECLSWAVSLILTIRSNNHNILWVGEDINHCHFSADENEERGKKLGWILALGSQDVSFSSRLILFWVAGVPNTLFQW